MTYVIIGIVIIIIVLFALRQASNQIRKAESEMIALIQTQSIAVLIKKYRNQYDNNTANKLATAMMYKLFGLTPPATTIAFINENKDLFQNEFYAIKSDEIAHYVRIVAKMNQRIVKEEKTNVNLEPYLKSLSDAGILSKQDNPPIPVSQEDYKNLAKKFNDFVERRLAS